jgi:hypothetical protein
MAYSLGLIKVAIAVPNSSVESSPPMSGVRTFDCAKTCAIAFSTASAASEASRCRSIIAPNQICPIGFGGRLDIAAARLGKAPPNNRCFRGSFVL